MATHLWTWSGKDFGDREGDELWTYDGRHVGHFYGTEVFAPDGRYLGELQRDDHLITRIVKRPMRRRKSVHAATRSSGAAYLYRFRRLSLAKSGL
jgi:hypothetical protein